jgi:hypothetical protein
MQLRQGIISKILWRHAWWENGDPARRAVGGNFDGQLMSLGTLQFAGLAGPLQPLIRDYMSRFPMEARAILNMDGYPLYEETMAVLPDNLPQLFDRINRFPGEKRRDNYIIEPWNSAWVRVAMSDEWQECERPYVQRYVDDAMNLLMYYEGNSQGDSIATDRGLDLCFDIVCQSGGTNRYPLGETAYMDKLNAIVIAYDNYLSQSEWREPAVARKRAILAGAYPMYGWVGEYDDQSIWEAEPVANATMNNGDLPDSVQPPPVENVWPVNNGAIPVDDNSTFVNEAIFYLRERGIFPDSINIGNANRPLTWGEMALVMHANNGYLWETHLKKIYEEDAK